MADDRTPAGLERVDHLVFATPDFDAGVREIRERFGVEPVPGGQHPVYGTRNALVALGDMCYLEILGPDPTVLAREEVRVFAIHELPEPRLVTWSARATDLEDLVDAARLEGVDLGTVSAGSRHRPDGEELTWSYTDPLAARNGGVLPFFIDWGETRHPAESLPRTCTLLELGLHHPHAANVEQRLRAIGIELPVRPAHDPHITARIRTPKGIVHL
jgi:hypothetical protein